MTTQISGDTGCSQAQAGSIHQDDLAKGVVGKGPCFSARGIGTQSVTSGIPTKAGLGVEEWDTNNNFASSTFTPTVAGYYHITGVIRCTANASTLSSAYAELWKNGVADIRGEEFSIAAASNGNTQQVQVDGILFLNGISDYVELYGTVVGTTPQFVNPTSTKAGTCYLQGVLVRAA